LNPAPPLATFEAEDDWERLNALYYERGWSDGLPIVPPSVGRVEAMLAYSDRLRDDVLARIPPRWGDATLWRLAANAVMAGCEPRYFPVICAAVEAMCEERFNLYGVQATTHLCAPLVIVNGPVARELGINAGHNAFGPGWRANATIGRAIRLILLNIGGALPGTGDMATLGSPAKFSYCIAENEQESPWEPLHVERGFPREASAVTVVGAEAPHNVNDHESITPEGVLRMIAGTAATTGNNDLAYSGEPVIAFGPEHAATVAARYSKTEAKRFLWEHAWLPLERFSEENIERRLRVKYPERLGKAPLSERVPVAQRPEDFVFVVVGGAGKHSAFIPTFGATRSVTVPLKRRDGTYARSVEDLRAASALPVTRER
jgi:hypothetical protein